MQRRDGVAVVLIIVLLFLLALELKYIEDSLAEAAMGNEEKCNAICASEGKAGYIIEGYCNCRVPITFSKRWMCFWNVSPMSEKSFALEKKNGAKPLRRIPVYPSEMFKEKIDPFSVRNYAVKAIASHPNSNDIATKIFGIYDYVSRKVSYISDPLGEEYVAWPNETLGIGGGDCEDYAILLASMYKSVGLKPTLVQVHNREYGHVFLIVPVGDTLNGFLEKYKEILEKNTRYSGEIPFHFMIFGTSKEHCEGINRNLADGGDINSFNIIIDGTTRDYPGSANPVKGYEFIKFITL